MKDLFVTSLLVMINLSFPRVALAQSSTERIPNPDQQSQTQPENCVLINMAEVERVQNGTTPPKVFRYFLKVRNTDNSVTYFKIDSQTWNLSDEILRNLYNEHRQRNPASAKEGTPVAGAVPETANNNGTLSVA